MRHSIFRLISLPLFIGAAACTTPPAPPLPSATLTVTKIAVTTSAPIPTESETIPPTGTATATQASSPTVSVGETVAPVETSIPEAAKTQTPIPTNSPTPVAKLEPIIELDGAKLPAGFSLRKVIDVDRPIGLQFDPTGEFLFISTQIGELRMYKLIDFNQGLFDYANLSTGFKFLHGMAFHPTNGDLYISTAGRITILRDTDNDKLPDQVIPLVENLPFGLHQNNVPKFGPDGMLYMGVGSTCDACIEEDNRSGTIMRFDPLTGDEEIVASGLRNPFDVAFHPETGDLFATDNGRDDLGDFDPAEELNHIVMGNDYGWPDCWNLWEGISCDNTTTAIEFYTAHSSVNNLLFYTGDSFPSDYANDLFALNFGSFLVKVDTGLQRTKLTPDGQGGYTAETEWFLTMPEGSFPLGLAQGPDGAIYFGDYINGGIWRISYDGE